MPLEDHEWDMVWCLVVDDLVGTIDPYGELKQRFPVEVRNWRISQTPAENAEMLINLAKRAQPSDDNPFSIRLLFELTRHPVIKQTRPAELAQVQKFIARLEDEISAARESSSDAFAARILPGSGEVFINRKSTRQLLRQMIAPEPNKPEPVALRVVGEAMIGKSYTYSFIHHLSASRSFSTIRVVLDKSSTAEDILRDLSVHLARPGESPADIDDPAKRAREWAQWLVTQSLRSSGGKAWWFVFDQCNELDPSSSAVELIAQLAIAVREVVSRAQRPRLVLLGYGDQLADLQIPDRQMYVDLVDRVDTVELQDFFTRVLGDILKTRTLEARTRDDVDDQLEKHVQVAVQQVIEEAEAAAANGDCYMKALSAATEGVVDVYSG